MTRKRKSDVLKGKEGDCKQNLLDRSYYLNQLHKDTKCNKAEYTVKDDNNPVIAAKISGTYGTYVNILAGQQKLRMKGINNCVYKTNQLVIDVFDGAHHCHNVKNPMSIITFSFQFLSKSSIHKIGSSEESGKICTWMQQMGPDKPENLFPVLGEIYKEKLQHYCEWSR